jgi:hypothetical protein
LSVVDDGVDDQPGAVAVGGGPLVRRSCIKHRNPCSHPRTQANEISDHPNPGCQRYPAPTTTRQAGSREHGHQTARAKRSRAGRASELCQRHAKKQPPEHSKPSVVVFTLCLASPQATLE